MQLRRQIMQARHNPPLQLPVGARVALIGDSITQYGNTGSSYSNAVGNQQRGEICQALASDPRFRLDVWHSQLSTCQGYFSAPVLSSTVSGGSTVLTFASTISNATTRINASVTVATGMNVWCAMSHSFIPVNTSVTAVTATTVTINKALTIPNGTIVNFGVSTLGFNGANFGIAGITTIAMEGAIDYLASLCYDIAVITIGTNDGGFLYEGSDNIFIMADKLVAKGTLVIIASIRARSDNLNVVRYQENFLLLSRATGRRGYVPMDLCAAYNPQPNGYCFYRYQVDGLHPSLYGAYAAGVLAPTGHLSILKTIIPAGNYLLQRYWSNSGNLLTNPTFTGTSGTLGATASGVVPTGWTVNNGSGTGYTTESVSVASNTDTGGQLVNLTITPVLGASSGAENIQLTPSATTAVTGGQWMMAWAEVDLPANRALMGAHVTLTSNSSNGDSATAHGGGSYWTAGLTGAARKVWLQTPPLLLSGDATQANIYINFDIPTPTSVTAVTAAAQPTNDAQVLIFPSTMTGVVSGMIASGTGISGTVRVMEVGGPSGNIYVTLDTAVTVASGTTITFAYDPTPVTPVIRRAWMGYCDNPLVCNHSALP